MSGGSTEPESPHDKQCDNCGLYYMDKGVSFAMHQSACSGSSSDGDTQPQGSGPSGASDDAPRGGTGSGGGGKSSGSDPTMGSGNPQVQSMSNSKEKLPCGHESFDPDDVPQSAIKDGKTRVSCSECDKEWNVSL